MTPETAQHTAARAQLDRSMAHSAQAMIANARELDGVDLADAIAILTRRILTDPSSMAGGEAGLAAGLALMSLIAARGSVLTGHGPADAPPAPDGMAGLYDCCPAGPTEPHTDDCGRSPA